MITHRSQRPGLTNMALLCCPASSRPLSPPPPFPLAPASFFFPPSPAPQRDWSPPRGIGHPNHSARGIGHLQPLSSGQPRRSGEGISVGIVGSFGGLFGACSMGRRPACSDERHGTCRRARGASLFLVALDSGLWCLRQPAISRRSRSCIFPRWTCHPGRPASRRRLFLPPPKRRL